MINEILPNLLTLCLSGTMVDISMKFNNIVNLDLGSVMVYRVDLDAPNLTHLYIPISLAILRIRSNGNSFNLFSIGSKYALPSLSSSSSSSSLSPAFLLLLLFYKATNFHLKCNNDNNK